MSILQNISRIKSTLPDHVCLVAVTKKATIEQMMMAYQHGLRDFAENRVEQFLERFKYFQEQNISDVRWHFVGHLQKNKLKKLLKSVNSLTIHSIDSFDLLEKIHTTLKNRQEENESFEKEISFFLQINTSKEKEKYGIVDESELKKCLEYIKDFQLIKESSFLQFVGLMTMSKLRTGHFEEEAERCFQELANMKKSLVKENPGWDEKIMLSMGMSADYEVALRYGADYVRIGSALFE